MRPQTMKVVREMSWQSHTLAKNHFEAFSTKALTDGPTGGPTGGPADGRTDGPVDGRWINLHNYGQKKNPHIFVHT